MANMSIRTLVTLLLALTSFVMADSFQSPVDANDPSVTNDASQNPVYHIGDAENFSWTTSQESVVLILLQELSDGTQVLCTDCTNGTFAWTVDLTLDLSKGNIFNLFISNDATGSIQYANSRAFNISEGICTSPEGCVPAAPSTTSTIVASSSTAQSSSTTTSTPSSSATISSSVPATTLSTSTAGPTLLKTPSQAASSATSTPSSTSPSTSPSTSSSSSSSSNPTALPPLKNANSNTLSTPEKIGISIGAPFLSLALLAGALFFSLRRRKHHQPARAQTPPPWVGAEPSLPAADAKTSPTSPDRGGAPGGEFKAELSSPVVGKDEGDVGKGMCAKAELSPETASSPVFLSPLSQERVELSPETVASSVFALPSQVELP